LKNNFLDIIKKSSVLDPNNTYIYFYYILYAITSAFLIFLLSLRWGFIYEEPNMEFFDKFKIFSICLYFVEIFINFNVGYFKMGRKIIDRELIVKNYFFGNLKYDILVIFSMLYTLAKKSNSWDCVIIDQFIYLKIKSFIRIKRLLEERFLKNN
jgi:hypothetical protein